MRPSIAGVLSLAAFGLLSVASSGQAGDGSVPGDGVHWLHYPAQKSEADASWGSFLTDLENHLPASYGKKYSHENPGIHAHETTHGINSHLTNQFLRPGRSTYGFYVGGDRAIVLVQPRLKLSQVASSVPKSVRGSRYKLYFIDQQKYFENDPLYVFDEWTAYTNGAVTGIELAGRKPGDGERTDEVIGTLEFSIYSLALAAAIKKHDPDYLQSYTPFREFLAHELRRSVRLYKQGMALERFRWERRLEWNLLKNDDTAALRELVQDLFGPSLTLDRLLVRGPGMEPLTPPREELVEAADAPGMIEGVVEDLAERPQPSLEVRLLDTKGQPIKDVKGKEIKVLTDDDGKYTIKNVPPGKYRVSAKKFGGAKGQTEVQVESGKTAKGDIEVKR